MRASIGAAWAVTLVAALAATPARADEERCPAPDGASSALASIPAAARLRFVHRTMADQARRARTWSRVWTAAGLAVSLGSFGLAAIDDHAEDRFDDVVGGVTALFIPASLALMPLRVIDDAAALDARLASVTTRDGVVGACIQLARAEELLARAADDERDGVIFGHVVAVAGNGAIALVLGLGLHHARGALLNGAGGFVISEVQTWTQPTGAIGALARYRDGRLDPATAGAAWWRLVPMLTGDVRGLAIAGAF